MTDQSDDALNWAGLVLAGVIVLVLTGVIVLAASTARRHAATPPVRGGQDRPVASEDGTTLQIGFAPGAEALPVDASQPLVGIADRVRADAGLSVTITGPVAPARAVQHALEADGLTADRIVIEPGAGRADGRVVVRVH